MFHCSILRWLKIQSRASIHYLTGQFGRSLCFISIAVTSFLWHFAIFVVLIFSILFFRFKELAKTRPLSDLINSEDQSEHFVEKVRKLSDRRKIKEYINVKEKFYAQAKAIEEKIAKFESSVKGCDFQPGRVEDDVARLWHKYLEFMEEEYPEKVCVEPFCSSLSLSPLLCYFFMVPNVLTGSELILEMSCSMCNTVGYLASICCFFGGKQEVPCCIRGIRLGT